jgi:thymidylate synthase
VPGDGSFKESEYNTSKPHEAIPYTKEEFIEKIKTDDEFTKKWGDLGPIYGHQWRNWRKGEYTNELVVDGLNFPDGPTYWKEGIDQIQNSINLLKTDPDSRRNIVSAWNPSDLDQMTLPPCHYGFQIYTRELSDGERLWICSQRHHIRFGTNDGPTWYNPDNPDRDKLKWMTEDQRQLCDSKNIPTRAISLMFNMRSNDVPLGLPFNIASYALLLEIIGKIVNMVPDELIASLGDAHIYKNQIDGIKEQLTRTPMKLPNLIISEDVNFNGTIDNFLESYNKNSFRLSGYESHPTIKIPLSN